MKLPTRRYVETRVMHMLPSGRGLRTIGAVLLVGAVGVLRGEEISPPKPALDELVYNDGDRVRGHLVEKAGDVLVFRSERFGVLHVPVAEAQVILAEKPKETTAAAVGKSEAKAPPAPGVTAEETEEESTFWLARAPFSPRALALALRNYFGAWHGKFSFSADSISDTNQHDNVMVEAKLERKWTKDEVSLTGRYDFSAVDNAKATDMVKGNGSYRHDLPRKLFFTYRPSVEWNRNYVIDGAPADYVLLQEEFGVGVNLLDTAAHKVRAGLSENLFDVWQQNVGHHQQPIESVFAEWEAKLPWRITLTDRGVWYYSLAKSDSGWENRFEINKRLTETLTIGVRHEARYNNPDVRSADYRLLRLMMGFDF